MVYLNRTGQGGTDRGPREPHRNQFAGRADEFHNQQHYFLPQAFPEGSPIHPAYPTGQGTVAGACITALKFFFDGNFLIPAPQVPSRDGSHAPRLYGQRRRQDHCERRTQQTGAQHQLRPRDTCRAFTGAATPIRHSVGRDGRAQGASGPRASPATRSSACPSPSWTARSRRSATLSPPGAAAGCKRPGPARWSRGPPVPARRAARRMDRPPPSGWPAARRRPGPSPRWAGGPWSAAGRCSSCNAGVVVADDRHVAGYRPAGPPAARIAPSASRSLAQMIPVTPRRAAGWPRPGRLQREHRVRAPGRRSARPGRARLERGQLPPRGYVVPGPSDQADPLVTERGQVPEGLVRGGHVVAGHAGETQVVDRRVDQYGRDPAAVSSR